MALLGAVLAELLIILGVFLIIYIIFKLGKFIAGILANVVLGFISIVIINVAFGLGIPFDLAVIILTAILGLPGVGIVVLLKILGVNI